MPIYTPPLRDQQFVLHELLGAADQLKDVPRYAEVDADVLNHVLEEAGKFCAEVLLPLNQTGDEQGCTYDRRDQGSQGTDRDSAKRSTSFAPRTGRVWPRSTNTVVRDCRT